MLFRSRVRTCHRREWAYALRFLSNESSSRFLGFSAGSGWEGLNLVEPASEQDSMCKDVREAISNLATSQQGVLVEIYLNGHTEAELGAMLHVSQCAVNKRKQAGLRALRETLGSAA